MTNAPNADNAANGGPSLVPCSVSLVWMPGPANGGGGTAEHDEDAIHRSWWYDGQLLLVIVNTNSGPEVSCIRVCADGDMLGFVNAATDEDFGWSDTDISWWAILDSILPQNAERRHRADENLNNQKEPL